MIFQNNISYFRYFFWGVVAVFLGNVTVLADVPSDFDSEKMAAFLKKTVMRHVLKRLPDMTTSNIVYQLKNPQQLAVIPARAHRYEFEINPKASLMGQTIIPCVFYDRHEQQVQKKRLYVDVDCMGPTIVTSRLLRKGTVIVSSDVRVVRSSLHTAPARYLDSLEDVVDHEVIRTVPEGAVLTTWTVQPKPLIRRNKKIFLLTDRSNVQLRVRGVALEDGQQGQVIRVKTLLDKSKMMKGTVKDHETVQIELLY